VGQGNEVEEIKEANAMNEKSRASAPDGPPRLGAENQRRAKIVA